MNHMAVKAPAFSALSPDVLTLDADAEIARIAEWMRAQVARRLRRRGAVVGLSGGIDSTVTAALAVKAFGPDKVLAVLMPEKDSDPESLRLGHEVADWLGIQSVVEDIEPMLTASACYERRDDFIRRLVPEFGAGWGCKVAISGSLEGKGYTITYLIVQSPEGEVQKLRMPVDVYLGVVAATNMKQRTRKQLEYYHADRLNYAVLGTPNRLEYDQGFFVKNGDGAADLKPIAHLYKTQVYQLAAYLNVPELIQMRPPTTDTYSLEQSQEEFFFAVSYDKLDCCLYGLNNGYSAAEVAEGIGLPAAQVELVYGDIESKRKAGRYLHMSPQLIERISG